MKKGNSGKILANLLHNKYVLYVSFFFAIFSVVNYLFNNNLEAIFMFLIIGFLTTYFSKNMIIVLLSTTIITNLFIMIQNRRKMEGMENPPGANSVATTAPTSETMPVVNTAPGSTAALPTSAPPAPPKENKQNPPSLAAKVAAATPSMADVSAGGVAAAPAVASTTGGNANNMNVTKESMSQLSPAPIDFESTKDPMLSLSKMANGRFGQQEQAYDQLNAISGNVDTDKIFKQQQELMNNMKSLEPLLKTAQGFLDKFENSSISKMVGNFPGIGLLTGKDSAPAQASPSGAYA